MKRITAFIILFTAALLPLPRYKAKEWRGTPDPSPEPSARVSASANSYAGATSAQSMMLMEAESLRILDEKNAFARLPMASTTKVVTALTVINNADIKKVVKVDPRAVGVEGSSIYLQANEELSIEQLLYGLMLQSGNDCAAALAFAVGGSVENFAAMMNETAERAGARESNFVNPHGLHHKDHYTTAYDLCLISCHAMRNPVFKKIVSTKSIKMPWAGRDYERVVNNKNKILNTFPGGNGVKTGFTKAAGRCLVSGAERNGMQIVCVVLNCGPMFEDCSALMERAFAEYERAEILPSYSRAGEVAVKKGKDRDKARLTVHESFSALIKKNSDERGMFEIKLELPEYAEAPINKNQPLGTLKIYYKNNLVFSTPLLSVDDIEKETIFDKIFG